MSVLVYDSSFTGFSKHLEKAITQVIPKDDIHLYNDMSNFTHRLRQPGTSSDIIIFFAATSWNLNEMLEVYSLLQDVRIIIVLFDRSYDTIRKAHFVRPRFITFANDNLGYLIEVLSRMLKN